ncbi:hypothetical protein BSL056_08785 [Bacillus safensis]|nr:hypothetical protein BSL056_08785 [Bacillus safensis]
MKHKQLWYSLITFGITFIVFWLIKDLFSSNTRSSVMWTYAIATLILIISWLSYFVFKGFKR